MWAKFSPAEMARRWRLARELMHRHDLIGLLVFGNFGVNRHNTVVTKDGTQSLHQVPFEPVIVEV